MDDQIGALLRQVLERQGRLERQLHDTASQLQQMITRLQQQQAITNRMLYTQPQFPLDESNVPARPLTELAVVAIARDEGPYIREWLEYHRLMGAGRFYFYDNGSADDTPQVLEPYIREGTVVYRRLDGFRAQEFAYNDAICRYRLEARWMAFIGLDEFLVPLVHDSVTEFLREFEHRHCSASDYRRFPAIAVNWVVFDSNGHEERPTAHGGLVTANYTRVRRDHDQTAANGNDHNVKCIVNPRQVLRWASAHNCIYVGNYPAVTETLEPVMDTLSRVHSAQMIRINHYHCKSRAEYTAKMLRKHRFMGRYNAAVFNEEKVNFSGETEQDTVIFRFLPALRQALGLKEE